MSASVGAEAHTGLERSCADRVRSLGPIDGVELMRARLARGFAPHRHDTYGIAVTELGVQTFDYRGRVERSLPGQVTVLHPDERHDGRAGTEAGFGYRIVYVAPRHIGAAVQTLVGRPIALPFVRDPVATSPGLASAVTHAFASGLEPLARDRLILRLAEGLLAGDPSLPNARSRPRLDTPALVRAREFLDHQRTIVRSAELEAITGLTRYELARQFRAAYGTSPYRYSLQRRLDHARHALKRGEPLADVALGSGFADQAHFTRMFAATYGLPPGRYAAITVATRPRAL
jgi:AraC-like DNA-binding protein